MSKSPSKESDIPELSHISLSVERHSIVVDSTFDSCQDSPGSTPQRLDFFSAALSEFSLQGTSIDLQSALTLLLSRMDKMESNIANVTRATFVEESLPRSRIKFLLTLIHQSIRGIILVRKLGPSLRSYVPLIASA